MAVVRIDTLPEDMVGMQVVPLHAGQFVSLENHETPRAGLLIEQLREELSRTDGTPEWRSWIQRAARRCGLAPT